MLSLLNHKLTCLLQSPQLQLHKKTARTAGNHPDQPADMDSAQLCNHHRRQGTQPLLTFSPQAAKQIPHAVQQLLFQCMQQLEQLGAAGSFGLQLDLLPDDLQQATTGAAALMTHSTGS